MLLRQPTKTLGTPRLFPKAAPTTASAIKSLQNKMPIPNSLRGHARYEQATRRRPFPLLLAASVLLIGMGYLNAVSAAKAWGPESGWGLAAPSAFIRSMGFTACIASITLLFSCIRRELFWPLSLLTLIPVSLYAIFYLVLSSTQPS